FIISTIAAALVAIGTFWVLAQLRSVSASVDLTTVIFSIFAIGWLLCPIFAFGLDGTLDPATMALYPLRTRPLVIGLLTASAAPGNRAAHRIGGRSLAGGQRARLAWGNRRAGSRTRHTLRVHRRGATGAVLHRACQVRHHQHGAAASLAPRQGPRHLPDRPRR